MDNEIKTLLYDTLTAIQERLKVSLLIASNDIADYEGDLRIKRAVERKYRKHWRSNE
ncbi:hypothetical protein EZS27_020913 [termite gut metagenome]|uniref:Uncharacterized protein n=1 Tax=termite gut metagenome TaxID=433724 RepID=A0A5J4R9E7_9ZZZZ